MGEGHEFAQVREKACDRIFVHGSGLCPVGKTTATAISNQASKHRAIGYAPEGYRFATQGST